jgi:hypothetical protein
MRQQQQQNKKKKRKEKMNEFDFLKSQTTFHFFAVYKTHIPLDHQISIQSRRRVDTTTHVWRGLFQQGNGE